METVASMGNEDLEMFEQVKQPAYINHNAYLKNAPAFDKEKDNFISQADPQVKISVEGEETYLEIQLEKDMLDIPSEIICTEKLGMVRIPEAPFDGPDGESIVLDTDYNGTKRCETPAAGPLEGLKEGYNKIKIWG